MYKRLLALAGWLICFSLVDVSLLALERNPLAESSKGSINDCRNEYHDVVCFCDTIIAVGTGGRIDRIARSGEIISLDTSCRVNLNSAYANNQIFLAAGEQGTIIASRDGRGFSRTVTGTMKNIYALAFKSGVFIAGADSGTILRSLDGTSWTAIPTVIRGNIVSLSANNLFIFGVTDAGEIIKSADGMKWEIQDYNKEYAGYNPPVQFRKISAGPHSVLIIGTHPDGSPSILFSSLGNVWAERPPVYQDEQGVIQPLSASPHGIAYDADRDQYVVACSRGELLVLPPCAKCNRWAKTADWNFRAILYLENRFLIVGDDFSVLWQDMPSRN